MYWYTPVGARKSYEVHHSTEWIKYVLDQLIFQSVNVRKSNTKTRKCMLHIYFTRVPVGTSSAFLRKLDTLNTGKSPHLGFGPSQRKQAFPSHALKQS